mgnify:CR=1 FL=1
MPLKERGERFMYMSNHIHTHIPKYDIKINDKSQRKDYLFSVLLSSLRRAPEDPRPLSLKPTEIKAIAGATNYIIKGAVAERTHISQQYSSRSATSPSTSFASTPRCAVLDYNLMLSTPNPSSPASTSPPPSRRLVANGCSPRSNTWGSR